MTKEEVAAALEETGTLLELKGESPFRTRAYFNGARAIMALESSLDEAVASGFRGVAGIGETLRHQITTLVQTGELPFLVELRASLPPGLLDMLRIPGLGPKKVLALYRNLKIETIDQLRAACQAGQVAKEKGFGTKTQENILKGIEFLEKSGQRVRIDHALPIAGRLLEWVRALPGVIRAEVCGSVRRRRETIKDIDVLVSSADPGPIMEAFVKLPPVLRVTGQGDTKASVIIGMTTASGRRVELPADLRVVSDAQFPFALHYFTGCKDHCRAMRARAIERGLKLNEYELAGEGKSVPCQTEEDIFEALGLAPIPPEMREDTGEMAAAEARKLPTLVTADQIRGVFHNHTDWSDGAHTLEEMALAAKKLGFAYLGIGDHSQSLKVANGLSPERVHQQLAAIDALNQRLTGITVFKGTECDILEDGSLDYDDDLLAEFDYVVASVHTYFQQPEAVMTERIIKAVSHPRVTMLGHATGRLLLRRDGYKVDLEAVLRAAAKHGTMVEINADPHRLDLDWHWCKRARALGVMLVINPDAHGTGGLANYRYGVDVARRGWLEAADVFNTRSLAEVRKRFAARKAAVA